MTDTSQSDLKAGQKKKNTKTSANGKDIVKPTVNAVKTLGQAAQLTPNKGTSGGKSSYHPNDKTSKTSSDQPRATDRLTPVGDDLSLTDEVLLSSSIANKDDLSHLLTSEAPLAPRPTGSLYDPTSSPGTSDNAHRLVSPKDTENDDASNQKLPGYPSKFGKTSRDLPSKQTRRKDGIIKSKTPEYSTSAASVTDSKLPKKVYIG